MPERDYLCINGDFLKANESVLYNHCRSFIHGESIVENIHAFATGPQFLELHMERLSNILRMLSLEMPPFFTQQNMHLLITRLLNKNRIYGGAWVKVTLFCMNEEKFISGGTGFSFVIDCTALDEKKYSLNPNGLNIGVCNGYIKQTGPFAGLRKANSYLFHMADRERKGRHLDEIILLNQSGRMVETTGSNIFLVSGRSVFTPGIIQGCIPGIMRGIIIKLAGEAGYNINDSGSLTPSALLDAEEIFLTNAIEGIRWVGAYQQSRYFKKTAKVLTELLNELAFN